MIQRMVRLVQTEIRGMHQAAYVLAVLTFGAQLLALVRDRLLAHTFGVGYELDVYYAAFRIPDLLFVVFASALSVYVLIPFVAERAASGGTEHARAFLSTIFSMFCVFYAVAAIIVGIVLPDIVPYVFPGFSATQQHDVAALTRLLLVQPFLLGVSGIFAVVTQLHHRFILYACSPLLYNIGIVVGILFLYPLWGLYGLAAGVVLGAVLHMAIQVPFVITNGLMPVLRISWDMGAVREVLRQSLPRAATLSLQQITLFVFIGIASTVAAGSVAAFQFAFNLQSVPLAIIGVSYSVAAFPLLAKQFAAGDMTSFRAEVSAGIRHIIFWVTPVVVLCIVLRAQMVRVVFGSGAFDWDATRITAAAFALFSLSILAQSLHLFLVRVWYAAGNTRVPLVVTTAMSIGSIVLGYEFVRNGTTGCVRCIDVLRVSDAPGVAMLGLPFAYSAGMLCGVVAFAVITLRHFGIRSGSVVRTTAQALAAALAAGTAAYATLNAGVYVFGTQTTLMGVLTYGATAGLVGIGVAGLVYMGIGSYEINDVIRAVKKRIPTRMRPALAADETPRD